MSIQDDVQRLKEMVSRLTMQPYLAGEPRFMALGRVLMELELLQQEKDLLVKTLKFYGCRTNYKETGRAGDLTPFELDSDCNGSGGKRARAALGMVRVSE